MNNETKQFSIAILHASLDITCPKCDHDFDLLEDDDGIYSKPIFNNEWDELSGESAYCPKCDFEFLIGEVIY